MKLNERDKLSIKLLYATGASQSEIARRFRVSRFTINGVIFQYPRRVELRASALYPILAHGEKTGSEM